jgi:RNA polymerase-binding transcription factor DksA
MAAKKVKTATYPKEILKPVEEHLNAELNKLSKRKADIEVEDPFNDRTRVDDNAAVDTDAAEQVGHMQANAVKQALDRSMIQIRKAMSRIKIGKYGLCERCGKFIDTDRLMIMPESTLCVACEKQKEK